MNRYYRPTAPRYTSQFIEDQYPFELAMNHMQMKGQQKAEFAKAAGELQGAAAIIPNGLRTSEMGQQVRDEWGNKIREWTTQNMSNYDSPQALAQLSSMHTQFQNDADVRLMKQDAEESKMYTQLMMQMDPGDIDPNTDPTTGGLMQFQRGQQYMSYRPLMKYQDVDKEVRGVFNSVPEDKYTSSYIGEQVDETTGEKVRVHGTRSSSRTNEDQFKITMADLMKKGKEGSTSWAKYKNESFRRANGRDMNDEDWFNYLAPIAAATKEKDYSDQWSPMKDDSSDGANANKSGSGVILDTEMMSKDDDRYNPSKRNINQSRLNLKMNVEDESDYRVQILRTRLSKDKDFQESTEAEKRKIMRKIVDEGRKREYSLQYETFDEEDEKSVNQVFGGAVNAKGVMDATIGGTKLSGQVIIDLKTGQPLNQDEKRKLTTKDKSLIFLGRPTPESRKIAKYPGLMLFESNALEADGRQYGIKIPSLSNQEKITHSVYGHLRNDITGVGDVVALDFAKDPNMMPQITDITDMSADGKPESVQAKSPDGLYMVTVNDINEAKGYNDVKVKVFKKNPTGTNVLDDNNELLVGEYWMSENQYIDEQGNSNPARGIYSRMAQDFYSGKLRNK